MEKFYTSRALSRMTGGRMHTSHPPPLDPPLAISCTNHQKHGTMSPFLNTLLPKTINLEAETLHSC